MIPRFIRSSAALLLLLFVAASARSATLHVSPSGNDANPGTPEKPLATLSAARDAARNSGAGPHNIVLRSGDYFVEKTVEFGGADNGLVVEGEMPGAVTLYGGMRVTGWKRDGDQLFAADLPGVKEKNWDFRALVVNGRWAPRARLPESGTFTHKSVFDVRWLSSVGGGWERKPTEAELSTLTYDPKDLPATLDISNAEVRVYHMWDESLCGIAANDPERHTLTLSPRPKTPPGGFGVKKYVVFNTREGMTAPGQWYLDRGRGRLVYWPLPGEDITKATVIAPRLAQILKIAGDSKKPVDHFTLRNVKISATTPPLMSGGFGATAIEGALHLERATACILENLEIANVGGQGVTLRIVQDCRLSDSRIHHLGAGGIRAEGSSNTLARNHIHDVGLLYPSAVAIYATTPTWKTAKGFHIYRNQIHDTPYSGVICSGGNHLIEENLISRVMREMHDGGAIYGGIANSILRGNVVRDIVKIGEGYGVSSYYLDEGAVDCIVEKNVSIGVERPTHNHMARKLTIRDNVFVSEESMTLSFQRSANITLEGNTLVAPGELIIRQPNAIKSWKDNRVFRGSKPPAAAKTGKPAAPGQSAETAAQAGHMAGGTASLLIDDAMPPSPPLPKKTSSLVALAAATPPAIDGTIAPGEWPGTATGLDRDPARQPASGAPALVKLAHDSKNLYVGITVTMFDVNTLSKGSTWGHDDGAEIAIAGTLPGGQSVTWILRGYAGGLLQVASDGGASADAAENLQKAVQFTAKSFGKNRGGWSGEFVIPWAALGLKPSSQKIPFNIGIYRTEDGARTCWEGTGGDNGKLDQAGTLILK